MPKFDFIMDLIKLSRMWDLGYSCESYSYYLFFPKISYNVKCIAYNLWIQILCLIFLYTALCFTNHGIPCVWIFFILNFGYFIRKAKWKQIKLEFVKH